ncbi:hypothetical protein L3X38_042248 [Prunus dulcis]|uniref:Uncharacterized protein n=1 Tax=Prunus dulcis TaxID=3755 RepID=A0AAD4YLE4_PRUDU|nr:hypothetical protein L3X38_042248 [Prunus dulcis]
MNSNPLPVSSISWKKPVNPVSLLHWTIPHFTRGERAAQVLADPSVRGQSRRTLKTKRTFSIFFNQLCHLSRDRAKPMTSQELGILEQVEDILVQVFLSKRVEFASNLYRVIVNPSPSDVIRARVLGEDMFRSFF